MKRIAIALAALAACSAGAQERAHPFELRLDLAREKLDRDFADWRDDSVQLAWKPRRGLAILGGARRTERFGLVDREGFGGAYLPLGAETTLHVEGTWSSTHQVLPRWVGLAEVSRALGGGWVAALGYKASRYSLADTEAGIATVEKYIGDWRLAYTASLTRLEQGAWSPVHRASATWYRGDLTYVAIAAGRGREIENVPPLGLVASDVRSASLGAGIEVMQRWGLTFEWAWQRQGDFYTRRTARIGTRLAF